MDAKGKTFVKITRKMVSEARKDFEKAKANEDWGRVLSLEGYINGLTQALANYGVMEL